MRISTHHLFLLLLAMSLLLPNAAVASDDDTFTQIGSFTVQQTLPDPNRPHVGYRGPTGRDGGGWQIPDTVNFPTAFGDVPQVVLSVSTFAAVPRQIGTINFGANPNGFVMMAAPSFGIMPQNITTSGFKPALTSTDLETLAPISVNWIAVGHRLHRGIANAKYMVLSVVYAPPGTNGGRSSSSVSYDAGSSTGITVGARRSFKTANDLSFNAEGGFLGNGGSAGVSFDATASSTDSQSIDIKKSSSSTISQVGPPQDGINHDYDEIWLLLNPTVNLALSSSSATWSMASVASPIQYVYVGWLNGHQPMPDGVAKALQSAGITAADYPAILNRDPLANGGGIDPARFAAVPTTFPYEPPYSASASVPTYSFKISNDGTQSSGVTLQDSYQVGLSLGAQGDFLDFAKATLKDTQTWSWTNETSQTSAHGSSESATVTVGGPSFGYPGNATVCQVYYDRLYKTFAFQLESASDKGQPITGSVLDNAGKPIPWSSVALITNGIEHRTFTNSRGNYRFFGHFAGPASLSVASITRLPQFQPSPKPVVIRIPNEP